MLLSACIIAKDEQDVLPACLASLKGVVDEVVVYDTGSSDATIKVAAESGATVVAGTWPGGFAEARNAALGHCRGEWVLSIDADEQLLCSDGAALRAELRKVPATVLALQVPIDNLTGIGAGSGYSHVADRLFRPTACRWRGRLHEQLVAGEDGRFPPVQRLRHARLRHHGYLHDMEAGRDKVERNLKLAEAEVADPSFGDRGIALVWLGRALWAADRPDEALDRLLEGSRTTANPVSRRQGLETAARIALRLDRLGDARAIIAELRAASVGSAVADLLEAGAGLAAGAPHEALRLLDSTGMAAGTVRDDDGHEYGPGHQVQWRVAALVQSGRPGEAADLALDAYGRNGLLDCDLDLVVEALEGASRPLDQLAVLVQPPHLPTVVAAALRLDPERSHRLFEALWRAHSERQEGAVTVLAGASMLGRLLDGDIAAIWARRLRDRGLGQLCPLAALLADPSAPPVRRLQAAGMLADRFREDPPADQLLAVLAAVATGTSPDHSGVPARWRPQLEAAGATTTAQIRWAHRPVETPDVSVILVATGGAETVLGALQALAATLPEQLSFEVIAVDPGSRDATRAVLASLGGDVAVVRTEYDVGAAAARNLGLRAAGGRIAVIVDGAARPRPGWIEALLDALDADRRIGVVAPALVDGQGRVRSASGTVIFGRPDPPPAAGLGRRPWGSEPIAARIDWRDRADVSGAVMVDVVADPVIAGRREDLLGVGGFDQGYWGGAETADLCYTMRAAGFGVAVAPASQVEIVSPAGVWDQPWASGDPRSVGVDQGAGVRWQARDNMRRFLERWGPADPA